MKYVKVGEFPDLDHTQIADIISMYSEGIEETLFLEPCTINRGKCRWNWRSCWSAGQPQSLFGLHLANSKKVTMTVPGQVHSDFWEFAFIGLNHAVASRVKTALGLAFMDASRRDLFMKKLGLSILEVSHSNTCLASPYRCKPPPVIGCSTFISFKEHDTHIFAMLGLCASLTHVTRSRQLLVRKLLWLCRSPARYSFFTPNLI